MHFHRHFNKTVYTTNKVINCITAEPNSGPNGLDCSVQFVNQDKRHPDFITDLILIGVFSAFSQIFIAFTIKNFGAVVFVIIMTTRSIPQVIFSWLVYHHYFGIFGWIGIVITFLTIGKLLSNSLKNQKCF